MEVLQLQTLAWVKQIVADKMAHTLLSILMVVTWVAVLMVTTAAVVQVSPIAVARGINVTNGEYHNVMVPL